MRKNILFFVLLAIACFQLSLAQKPVSNWTGYLLPEPESPTGTVARYSAGTPPTTLTGGCPNNRPLGSASNMFTHILTEANNVAIDNNLNTVIYAHRNNAGVFGGHSGQLRYDISTNGGVTWTTNQGILNPLAVNGTNGARYPNVTIYNPSGNIDPNNAYLGYYAATVGATFNGTVSGVRRLNGTGTTETYNQPTGTQTLIPRALVKGAPGVFWSIDNVYNGTAVTGYRVLKGTWNGTNDIVWAVNTTINPTFNTAYDATVKTADYAIAFDPTGNIGWICMLTHVTPGPIPYAFYPVFYKTTNGGTTWTGPSTVDLGQYPCITNNVQAGNVPSAAFDVDLAVDVYGNPHALMAVCNGSNTYSVFFTQWHAMVDVTMNHGVWNPTILHNVYRGRGTFGTAPNTVAQDMEPQVSRTVDGTKVFFTWTDADSSVLQATADISPNLFGKAVDVVNRKWTARYNFTSCNPTWNGKMFFPKMAETVLSNTGNYKLPIVFGEMGVGNDPLLAANFHYLDSIWYAPGDFTTNQCQSLISISPFDTIIGCGSVVLDAGAGGQVYAWSTGATTQAITVTANGTYSVGVSKNCCIGSDSVVVVMITAPVSNFSAGMAGFTATMTNTSTGAMSTYLWDFGDGSFSTSQTPIHTYSMPGNYQVCLTVTNSCGSDSTCHTVSATCPAASTTWSSLSSLMTTTFNDMTAGNVVSWTWDFGDGSFSNSQNPVHSYSSPGNYTVCLTTTDSCGTDSSCHTVTATCLAAVAAWSYTNVALAASFTDQTVGNVATWSWTFGDGATSTQQNPSHTYATPGPYTVCLVITDSCGTDSVCHVATVCSLPVAVSGAPDPIFGFQGIPSQFSDSSSGATSWHWDFGNGDTSSLQNPTYAYPLAGTYTICITVTNACGSDSTCFSYEVDFESIHPGLAGNWSASPNPSHDRAVLLGLQAPADLFQVRLLNALGQVILEREHNHAGGTMREAIDLSNLANGIYYLEVRGEKGRFVTKIVKE